METRGRKSVDPKEYKQSVSIRIKKKHLDQLKKKYKSIQKAIDEWVANYFNK
jgi:uncharacterized protein (DUF4415 family)